jgi:L-lactate dehydrogenase complex protein LldG
MWTYFVTASSLGVAENGSVWIKDEQFLSRVLPFITQQLAVVIKKENIVATMHDAYDVIANTEYGYAAFIAGPSKTADIEQSLVLGAHGSKTMTVFIL